MHIFFAKIIIFFSPQTFLAMKSEKTSSFPTPYVLGILGRCLARGTQDLGGAQPCPPRSSEGVARAIPFHYFRFVNVKWFNCSIVQLKNVPREDGEAREKIVPIYKKDIEIPLYILFIYKITSLDFIFKGEQEVAFPACFWVEARRREEDDTFFN